jgi:hypothetical protein
MTDRLHSEDSLDEDSDGDRKPQGQQRHPGNMAGTLNDKRAAQHARATSAAVGQQPLVAVGTFADPGFPLRLEFPSMTAAVMQVLYEGFKDSRYRPAPLLVEMVEAGCLGRKTGRGFYTYG